MKVCAFILTIILTGFLFVKSLFGILYFGDKMNKHIYKSCIYNHDYIKFNGIIDGSAENTLGVNIKYEISKGFNYKCSITDAFTKKYNFNEMIDIFVLPSEPTKCYTCNIKPSGLRLGYPGVYILEIIVILVIWIIIVAISFNLLCIIDIKLLTEYEIYNKLFIHKISLDLENGNIILNVKCPFCRAKNNFSINNQKLFESSCNTECVSCHHDKANIFFPQCKHVLYCDKCAILWNNK